MWCSWQNYLPLPDLFILKNKYRFNNNKNHFTGGTDSVRFRGAISWGEVHRDMEGPFHRQCNQLWRLEAGCRKARPVGQKGPLNYWTFPQPFCKCYKSGCRSVVDRYRCSHQISESWCGLWFLVAMYPFHSHSSVRFIVLETSHVLSQELKLKNACEFPMLVLPPLWVWLCGEWVWMNQVLIPLPDQSLLRQMYQCQDAWTAIDTFVPTPEIKFIHRTTERTNSCPLHCVFWSRLMYDEISLFIPANTAWKESGVCFMCVCVHAFVCMDIHACLYMTVNSCF